MEKIDNKTTEILAYVAEKSKRWTSQGKDALANLKALGSANLPKGDEIIIAKNILNVSPICSNSFIIFSSAIGWHNAAPK